MTATLQFNPDAFSERALKLILRKAQEWNCAPADALSRILDEQAAKADRRKTSAA